MIHCYSRCSHSVNTVRLEANIDVYKGNMYLHSESYENRISCFSLNFIELLLAAF